MDFVQKIRIINTCKSSKSKQKMAFIHPFELGIMMMKKAQKPSWHPVLMAFRVELDTIHIHSLLVVCRYLIVLHQTYVFQAAFRSLLSQTGISSRILTPTFPPLLPWTCPDGCYSVKHAIYKHHKPLRTTVWLRSVRQPKNGLLAVGRLNKSTFSSMPEDEEHPTKGLV